MDKEVRKNNSLTRCDRIYLLPVIVISGYIPLIMRMVEYDPGLSLVPWGYEGTELDFFLIWKMRAMLIVSALMLGMLIYKFRKDGLSFRAFLRQFPILIAYSVLVLLSGLMTPWRRYAFTGTYEMFRTVPLVLSYVLMCIYSFFIIKTKSHLIYIAKGASPGVFITGVIGALQTFGINIFNVHIVKLLMLPRSEWDYAEEMTVGDGVYATMFNPDYFAVYAGMLLPVIIILVMIIRNTFWRIFAAINAVLFIICLVGTGTASVIIALLCTILVAAFVLFARSRKSIAIYLICCAAVAAVAVSAILLIPSFCDRIHIAFFGTDVYQESMKDPVIETLDDEIVFTYPDGRVIHITYDAENTISIKDGNNESIPLVPFETDETEDYIISSNTDTDYLALSDEDYELTVFSLVTDEEPFHYIRMLIMGKEYDFTNGVDGTYYYISPGKNEPVKITPPEKYRLFPDAFMSGRGWIWNYSLTMLKRCMLTGIGSNDFVFEFPHDYAHYADECEFDVKPHSMYLQQWIENGFPAFLLLCAFCFIYLKKTAGFLKSPDTGKEEKMIALGLFCGIICYMISGLVNDSMMFISPFFWIFTGTGSRLYRFEKNDRAAD